MDAAKDIHKEMLPKEMLPMWAAFLCGYPLWTSFIFSRKRSAPTAPRGCAITKELLTVTATWQIKSVPQKEAVDYYADV
jgi:hypothetical protein